MDRPVLNLGGHCHEGLLHIGGILRTRLQEGDADLVSKRLKIRTCDGTLVAAIMP